MGDIEREKLGCAGILSRLDGYDYLKITVPKEKTSQREIEARKGFVNSWVKRRIKMLNLDLC